MDHLVPSPRTTLAAPPPPPTQSPRIVTVPQNASHNNLTGLVISKIEDTLTSMVEILAGGGDSLSMPYRSRTSPRQAHGVLRFPGSSVQEATKFARMMRIMELAREALVSGRLITKRNIYYQNPDLFKNQGNVDQLVDDLAFTFRVGRDALNIVAASKGLLAGPIKLIMKDNSIVSCSSGLDDNNTIPPIAMIRQIDFATLGFLNLIHSLRPIIPILCVVDCDPYGVDIMRTYKYGSRSLGHEENATVPGLQWLGVKMEDILRHISRPWEDGPRSSADQSSQSSGRYLSTSSQPNVRSRPRRSGSTANSLIPLTATDRKTAQRMFRALTAGDRERDHEETEQLRELQVMLMLNMKAEIQAIDDMGDLSNWLDNKIGAA
ncbi:hypothetical protein VSDG_06714 [Cytospora chrysosperma]|uniref:DNA topoisomerase (ATP-hydrolyzing) n=1 Tax=Cytospora chrysosperma TaxID=252740 RepID=A0A423VNB2_CYTCH|nr:hypothetical protein VSDG_06714 [Valsa sordida]